MKRLAAIISGTLLTLIILLAMLFGTPFGARVVVWVADSLSFLSITYVDGRLNKGLQLENIEVELDGIYVNVARLDSRWQAPCLLNRHACFDVFHADGVRVEIDTDQIGGEDNENAADGQLAEALPQDRTPLAPGEYEGMPLPLTIIADDLQLTDIEVRINDMDYNAAQLTGAAEVSSTLIWVERLNLVGADIHIPLGEDDEAQASNEDAAQHSQEWALAHLPEIDLPFEIQVDRAEAIQGTVLVGWMDHKIERLRFNGSWQHTQLYLPQIDVLHNWADANGQVFMDFRDGYGLETQLVGKIDDLPWQPELAGHHYQVKGRGSLTDLNVRLSTQGPLTTEAKLDIQLGDPSIPYALQVDASSLAWPLTGEPLLQGQAVKMSSHGNLAQQRLFLEGQFRSETFDDTAVKVILERQPDNLVIEHGLIDGDMGRARLNGEVSLGAPWRWALDLDARQFDLSRLDKRFDLQLDGIAHSEGLIDGKRWQIAINRAALTGRWLDYPISLNGDFAMNDRLQGYARRLDAQLNQSRLQLDGAIVDNLWRLSGKLQIDDLSVWDPGLTGQISSTIKMTGPADAPQLQIDASAEQLNYLDLDVADTRLQLKHWPLQNYRFDATLNTSALAYDDRSLGSLVLHARGDLDRQDMDLDLNGRERIQAALGGNLYDEGELWRGALLSGRLSTDYGAWETDLPALMQLRPFEADLVLGDHCWVGSGTELCLPYPIRLGPRGAVALDLQSDLAQALTPILPGRLQFQAGIEGQVYLAWQPDLLPYIKAEWTAPEGAITIAHTGGLEDSRIQWSDIRTSLAMGPDGVEIFNFIRLGERQAVEVELNLGPEKPYQLSGKLLTDDLDISPFLALEPSLADAAAQIVSELTFAGTLEQPEIQGHLLLKDGQLSTFANPTGADGIELDVNFQGSDASLTGKYAVGKGKGAINGQLNWQQGLAGDLTINGEDLQLLFPPMLVFDASPDLRFNLKPGRLTIRGDVLVPRGNLTVNALPEGTVKLSDDVVYIDQQEDSEEIFSTVLDLDVNLTLRNRLEVEAFGVTGNMGGQLALRQQPNKPFQLFGDLALEGGRFQAFGQRLEIRQGRFNFTGPPGLPRIDAEAVRVIEQENVTAGVRISGTADAPQLTLFSSPAMEQQEILSYITQGRGLNASDSGGSLFTATALGFGVNRTGGVMTRIGEGMGLRDLAVDTEGDGTDTQVTVSAYLGENLFVKYGVGVIGESINEIAIRYYLQPRLWLEVVNEITETTEQSLDLFYSFDIN